MTAPKRPAAARKVTTKTEANRQEALNQIIGIKVDGTEYSFMPADMSGLMEREIRARIGMGALELFERLQAAPGMDLIGTWIWVCQYVGGDKEADLDAALASVSWASEIDIAEDMEGPDLPEA